MSQRPSLRQQFGADFAASAFRRVDGEERIVGKFGDVTQLDDGTYDAWFHAPDLGGEGLSEHRLTNIEKNLPVGATFTRLTGEGYSRSPDPAFVRDMAPLIGIKRKRRVSAETRERLRRQLAEARSATRTLA